MSTSFAALVFMRMYTLESSLSPTYRERRQTGINGCEYMLMIC